jgi:hypothetical protein
MVTDRRAAFGLISVTGRAPCLQSPPPPRVRDALVSLALRIFALVARVGSPGFGRIALRLHVAGQEDGQFHRKYARRNR